MHFYLVPDCQTATIDRFPTVRKAFRAAEKVNMRAMILSDDNECCGISLSPELIDGMMGTLCWVVRLLSSCPGEWLGYNYLKQG